MMGKATNPNSGDINARWDHQLISEDEWYTNKIRNVKLQYLQDRWDKNRGVHPHVGFLWV